MHRNKIMNVRLVTVEAFNKKKTLEIPFPNIQLCIHIIKTEYCIKPTKTYKLNVSLIYNAFKEVHLKVIYTKEEATLNLHSAASEKMVAKITAQGLDLTDLF